MANEHGEIRYDSLDLPDDAHRAALTLAYSGTLTCTVCGFATANRLIAVTQDAAERGTLFQRPSGLGDAGSNDYTLWLRSNDNQHAGAWLLNGTMPTPDYLIEKGLANREPDGLVVATFIALVDAARDRVASLAVRPEDAETRYGVIKDWAEHAQREQPAFLADGEGLPPAA